MEDKKIIYDFKKQGKETLLFKAYNSKQKDLEGYVWWVKSFRHFDKEYAIEHLTSTCFGITVIRVDDEIVWEK